MMRRARADILPAERRRIIAGYKRGRSTFFLATVFHTWPAAIASIVAEAHVRLRTFSQSQRCRRRHEHPFFSVLSRAARYWAGFIVADGSLATDRGCIRIGLARRDRAHLARFLRDLRWTRARVVDYETTNGSRRFPASSIEVTDRRLVQDLLTLGVAGVKADRGRISRLLSDSPDFWRGVIDGDGSLTLDSRRAVLSLVGGRRLLEQYRAFVRTIVPLCAVKLQRHRTIWAVQLSGRHAELVIRYLYANALVALKRKRAAAKRILARIPKRARPLPAARYGEAPYTEVPESCRSR